mmetsp:Transcript_30365/g.66754  ORF Transcript_30365/g.66754 Transcript_30365/m.66754 type:complete len:344 (+) Transcript_30365:120-1151(+)
MIRATRPRDGDSGSVPPSVPSIPAARLVGHDGPILDVEFTADGKYALTGGNDRTVRLWNPMRIDPGYIDDGTGAIPPALPIQTYTNGHSHPVSAIAVDPHSTTMITASDRTVVVTDIVSKRVKRRFHGHSGRINSVACSSNAETFLSAGYDGKIYIFDGRSWNASPIQILDQATDSVTSVSVWQEGASASEIITASVDGVVRYYDLRMGQIRSDDVGDAITGLAFTHDGHCSAATCLDGTIRLIERNSGELLRQYSGGHQAGNYGLEVTCTADDLHIVSGSEDGSVVLYDLVGGHVVQTLKGHDAKPTCAVAAHPKREETSVVISASYDGNAIVWASSLHATQ